MEGPALVQCSVVPNDNPVHGHRTVLSPDAAAEGVCRAIELSALASEAVLDDPYRGQRCCDLPIGRATEIGHSELVSGLKRPEVEITVAVRCHFEVQEGE